MKEWEDLAKTILAQGKNEVEAIDMLQLQLKDANIFASEDLVDSRIDIATQIVTNVTGKTNE